jgi:hypothetical protein
MNIRPLESKFEDLEMILSLQKAAYRSEAEIHNDFSIVKNLHLYSKNGYREIKREEQFI